MTATRRGILGAALALPVLIGRAGAQGAVPTRVAVVDWGLASTMVSLGLVPAGVTEIDLYNRWVSEPKLPAGVQDLGLRTEPNMEALASLRPDLIVTTPFSASVIPMMERIAPTLSLGTFMPGAEPLERSRVVTRELAKRLGAEAQAGSLLDRIEGSFDSLRRRLGDRPRRPILLATFSDARHARVYGTNSLFGNVLARLGLSNAWQRPTTFWGFSVADTEAVAAYPEAQLFYHDPTSPDVLRGFAGDGLLGHLPIVRAGRAYRLPAVWAYGDVVAAERFATVLVDALVARDGSHAG
ncbi:ABC transporter substrate-binding protein [Microvirga pudoricolor]|uniref:ABC transporter substrate-binding protein n=1 Tax=Microvirga pudoricolor TaxID=2778729 RepID=UPI00194DFC2A|nr:ABC transporter substrate-binding protein [Microvirga pudoricolor]MBM6593313.1 ABC transporter substrate-binding protein [Microvirga pudoricolor]